MPLAIPDRGLHSLILYEKFDGFAARLTGKEPLPLLSVGNRFLVEHQLEWLSDQGFKQVILGLNDRSGSTERVVRGGARWLTQASIVMDPLGQPLKARLRKALAGVKTGVLIVDGSSLFRFDFPDELEHSTCFISPRGQMLPIFFCAKQDLNLLLDGPNCADVADLSVWMNKHVPNCRLLTISAFYHRIQDVDSYLILNHNILARPEILSFNGSLTKNGVRHGRRLRRSREAVLEGPTLIGNEVFIRSGVEIGPRAFIGDRSYIDKGARIVESVIAPDTYIGPNTCFEGKYVCRNYVLDLVDKTSVFVDDPVILADLTRRGSRARGLQSLIAAILLVFSLPLFLLLLPLHRLLYGCWVHRERVLKQPVKRNLKNEFDFQWFVWYKFRFDVFAIDILPSLWNIATGNLEFVGNPPLGKEDVANLEEMWRGDRLRGIAGCTGLAQQLDCSSATPEEVFAAIMYYNATRSPKGDMILLMKALITGRLRRS